ncbi:MAG: PilZ domain-containing protein [Elusimicrobia bacterium]|mgnify:CR=1 FL=1|nr:PilZ domain-containing protein [Elusimicrobiota bacterium]
MAWEGLNRRRFPRVKYPCLIKIREEGRPEEAILTHTENISVGGVAVIVKRAFELFAPISIEIDLMDGEEQISCRAKIVWVVRRKAVEAEKPSFYDLGIEFVDMVDEDRGRIARAVEHLVKGLQKAKIS